MKFCLTSRKLEEYAFGLHSCFINDRPKLKLKFLQLKGKVPIAAGLCILYGEWPPKPKQSMEKFEVSGEGT